MEYVSYYESNEFEKYLSIRRHLRERKQSRTFIFNAYSLSNLFARYMRLMHRKMYVTLYRKRA